MRPSLPKSVVKDHTGFFIFDSSCFGTHQCAQTWIANARKRKSPGINKTGKELAPLSCYPDSGYSKNENQTAEP
jgi:hypothetical protein